MSRRTPNYGIAASLFTLTEEQVTALDRVATAGAGWDLYCHSFINRPAVFRNRISGRFRNIGGDDYVEVTVGERQITTFCSTCRNGAICEHSVALLYSWVYDHDAFLNVADSIEKLESMEKDQLIELIVQFLAQDANNIEYLLKSSGRDEDFDLEGFLN